LVLKLTVKTNRKFNFPWDDKYPRSLPRQDAVLIKEDYLFPTSPFTNQMGEELSALHRIAHYGKNKLNQN
jgi:hypothetical protein